MSSAFLTSQNSSCQISVAALFGLLGIDNFDSDAMASVSATSPVEVSKGADGKISFAAKPQMFEVTVTVRANSDCIPYMMQYNDVIRKGKQAVISEYLQFSAPSLGLEVTYTNGSLSHFVAFPEAKASFGAIEFKMTYDDVSVAVIPVS